MEQQPMDTAYTWLNTDKPAAIPKSRGLDTLARLNAQHTTCGCYTTVTIERLEFTVKKMAVTADPHYVLLTCIDHEQREFQHIVPWGTQFHLYLGERT